MTLSRIAVFLAAIAPAVVLIGYGRAKTHFSWTNEAVWTACFLGGVGAIGAIPVELALGYGLKQLALPPLANAAIDAVFVTALVEEAVKFGILVGPALNHIDRRRFADIVALGLMVSLGFAAVENIFYIARPGEWHTVAIGRAVTAVPGHGLDGLAMGALVAWARLRPDRALSYFALALAVPFLMHGAYDFPLMALAVSDWDGWRWLWAAAIAGSAIVAIGLCNVVLPVAFEADRLAGHAIMFGSRARYVAAGGVGLVLVGAVFAVVPFALDRPELTAPAVAAATLPVALGADLLCEALRRRRQRAAALMAH